MDERLTACSSQKHQLQALWDQIVFHRDVLKSKGQRWLFQKTKKGRTFTCDELNSNLKEIIRTNDLADQDADKSDGLTYVPMTQAKEQVSKMKNDFMIKINRARNKIKAEQQQKDLPAFLGDPKLLKGKLVKHLSRNPGQDAEWFRAKVIDIDTTSNEPYKTTYLVEYDDFPNEQWSFPLLQDFKKGDLILITDS